MKIKLSSVFLLLLIAKLSFSQATFTKRYSKLNVTQTIHTHDGGYIVGGQFNYDLSNGDSETAWQISKLNSNCDTLWSKYFTGHLRSLVSIVETFDYGFIVGGRQQDSVHQYNDYISIIRLDSAGNRLWSQHIPFGDPNIGSNLHALTETSDSGIVILATSQIYAPSQWNHYSMDFIKLDKNGTMLLSKKFFVDPNNDIYAFQYSFTNTFKQQPNGDFLIAGSMGYLSTPYEFVLRLDAAGNIIRCRKNVNYADATYSGIISTTGDDYFIYGGLWIIPSSILYPMVMKCNSLDQIMWAKCYKIDGGTFLNNFETSGTGAAFVFFSDYQHDVLTRIDSLGSVMWSRIFSLDTTSNSPTFILSSVLNTSDGGYLLSGSDNTMQIIKTDSMGLTWCADSIFQLSDSVFSISMMDDTTDIIDSLFPRSTVNVGIYDTTFTIYETIICATQVSVDDADNDFSISCYPNPTTGNVSIDIQRTNISTVNILNSFGQIVNIINTKNKSHLNVDINGPPGFYFVRCENENGARIFRIVKY